MRRIILAISICGAGITIAMQTVDLKNNQLSCNGKPITPQISESWIQNNCKDVKKRVDYQVSNGQNPANRQKGETAGAADDSQSIIKAQYDKLSFHTDNNQFMKCYFASGKLVKCKLKTSNKNTLKESAGTTK